MFEAIVIGGGFAGLSATMYLARARRRVLLVDAGEPRNRFADASHGFLGMDGKSPAAIRTAGRAELAAYGNVSFFDGKAVDAVEEEEGFTITMNDGRTEKARRLVLAFAGEPHLPSRSGFPLPNRESLQPAVWEARAEHGEPLWFPVSAPQ